MFDLLVIIFRSENPGTEATKYGAFILLHTTNSLVLLISKIRRQSDFAK